LRSDDDNDLDSVREAAERRRRKNAMRLEAERAAADPSDLAEARRVRAEMDELALDWPEL
jgi:hypothetical protein